MSAAAMRKRRRPRRAAVVLETILALPLFVMMLLAIVEFGVYFSNAQQHALASRVGAEEASQTMSLSTTNNDPVPNNVLIAIDQQLGSSGITACRVILIHNVGLPAGTTVELSSGACDCDPPTPPNPSPGGEFVQVTVCCELTDLMPNCLSSFGFDITGSLL